MTPEQLQEFRTNLEKAEFLSVRALVEDREDMWREPRAEAGDRAGVGQPTGSLAEIREALIRIENGVFGLCTRCGKAVGMKRLTAMPWTPLCAECGENAAAVDAGSLSSSSGHTKVSSGTGPSAVSGAQE